MPRRRPLLFVAPAVLAAPSLQAQPAPWPQRTVRIVVPYSAGGASDIIARLLAPHWQAALGQTVVVDNRPGAGSMIGTEHAARVGDGHTVLLADAPFTIIPAVQERVPYDAAADFAPITLVGGATSVLLVHAAFPARSVAELLAAGRARPEAVSFGGSGVGSLTHLLPEWFGQLTGVRFANLAYRGGAPALQDLAAGQINAMFGSLFVADAPLRAGTVRPIAVASVQRLPELPSIRSLREEGVELIAENWYGVLVPATMPEPVRRRLFWVTAPLLAREDFRRRLAVTGLEPRPPGPEAFARILDVEFARWAEVARAAGLRSAPR